MSFSEKRYFVLNLGFIGYVTDGVLVSIGKSQGWKPCASGSLLEGDFLHTKSSLQLQFKPINV